MHSVMPVGTQKLFATNIFHGKVLSSALLLLLGSVDMKESALDIIVAGEGVL